MFPPELWGARDVTMSRGHRTNNISEAWNDAFLPVVGQKHPSVWNTMDGFRKHTAYDEAVVTHEDQGQRQPKNLKRTLVEFQNRVRNLCEDHQAGRRDMGDFLRGVAGSMKA